MEQNEWLENVEYWQQLKHSCYYINNVGIYFSGCCLNKKKPLYLRGQI